MESTQPAAGDGKLPDVPPRPAEPFDGKAEATRPAQVAAWRAALNADVRFGIVWQYERDNQRGKPVLLYWHDVESIAPQGDGVLLMFRSGQPIKAVRPTADEIATCWVTGRQEHEARAAVRSYVEFDREALGEFGDIVGARMGVELSEALRDYTPELANAVREGGRRRRERRDAPPTKGEEWARGAAAPTGDAPKEGEAARGE